MEYLEPETTSKYIWNVYALFNHPTILLLTVELYSWDRHIFKDRYPMLEINLRVSVLFSSMIK